MEGDSIFDLPEFMFSHFSRVELHGNLFEQWPAGIRFEIGIELSRAAKLFESVFERNEQCILISQDWPPYAHHQRGFSPLFETPGIFAVQPSEFRSVEVSPFDCTPYRLTWSCLPSLAFDAKKIFQGVASREQPGSPKIGSAVYVINPTKKMILHMYDDRGMDIIAAELESIRPLFR